MGRLEEIMAGKAPDGDFASDNQVRIISCDNKREEAIAAANIISREIRENGYRFKDFIVVARNSEDYASFIARQCAINNISCFMDKSVKLSSTSLGVYVANVDLHKDIQANLEINVLEK